MKSIWMKNRTTEIVKLKEDMSCDLLIVGAGLSGLLCAYQLKDHFKDIVMIESDEIGSGASGRSTGKLTSQHGFNYQKILKAHGKEKARLYYESNENAIHEIRKIIDEFGIECEYDEMEAVIGCKSNYSQDQVKKEIEAYEQLNIPYQPIHENTVEGINYGALFSHQAHFDAYQFCIQLAEKLPIRIYEYTPMMDIHDHIVRTSQHQIHYECCIMATQVMPFQLKFFYMVTQPKQSFLAALKPSDHRPQMILSEDEVTKTKNDMTDFMLVGGYDHKLSDDINYKWQSFKRDLVLEYPKHKVLSMWSSQDYEVNDYLPIVDKLDDFLFITGFNKWGLSNSYAASTVIKDIILHEESALRKLYSLHRSTLVFNQKLLSDNFDVVKNLIRSKQNESAITLPREKQSASFTVDGHPYGIYRENDVLYINDILCTHLGCTLKFNEHELCWDCPCHGSRFNLKGEIMKGPARTGLHHVTCSVSELMVDKK